MSPSKSETPSTHRTNFTICTQNDTDLFAAVESNVARKCDSSLWSRSHFTVFGGSIFISFACVVRWCVLIWRHELPPAILFPGGWWEGDGGVVIIIAKFISLFSNFAPSTHSESVHKTRTRTLTTQMLRRGGGLYGTKNFICCSNSWSWNRAGPAVVGQSEGD